MPIASAAAGRLADGAHVEARPRAREVERDARRRSTHESVDEPRSGRTAIGPTTGRSCEPDTARIGANEWRAGIVREVEVVAEVRREPGGAREDREREPRDDLVRAQRDHEERVDQRDAPRPRAPRRRPRRGSATPAGPPTSLHDEEAHHGADEHHPLDAEVEHARALGEQLAERGEEERRAVGDRRRERRRRRCCCSRRRLRGRAPRPARPKRDPVPDEQLAAEHRRTGSSPASRRRARTGSRRPAACSRRSARPPSRNATSTTANGL